MALSASCLPIYLILIFSFLIEGEERTEANNFDYYETYFAGTQNILGSNDLYKSGYAPKMVSHGENFKMEPGQTLTMECKFRDLSEEFLPKIVWRKLDRKNSLIAEGVNIVNINFVRKTTVQVDGEGSVLTLAPVTHRDAGMYQCSLAVGRHSERIVHNVQVIISPELETRNINWQLANRNNTNNLWLGANPLLMIILTLFSIYLCWK